MMAFSFKIDKPMNLDKTLAKVKREIEKHKGSFSGDEKRGSLSSSGVEGFYVVTDDAVEITITKKPPIASKAYVEKEIRKSFSEIIQ